MPLKIVWITIFKEGRSVKDVHIYDMGACIYKSTFGGVGGLPKNAYFVYVVRGVELEAKC